jgi:two-component system chemotaxis sensor kinase CheA
VSDDLFDRSEFIAYFRDEAEDLLQQIDADLLALEEGASSGKPDAELVNSLFRALHTIKGSAGMLQFSGVQKVAHKLENLCDVLRKGRVPISERCLELLFAGGDVLTGLVREAIQGRDAAEAAGFTERLDAFAAACEEAPLPAAPPEPENGGASDARAAAGEKRGKRKTIRVDIGRLDLLLDLVGELVINRTRISDIANALQRGPGAQDLGAVTKDLADSAAMLARTTGEIQESIMKVRMVPIGQVFERFPRLVRDIAKARGKEVQLEIVGGETDLDKTIVDEVGEPLMHLLRNCLDHGIEAPEERARRGKPATGRIVLKAYHEGNQIIIEVSDDGRGIDLERVRLHGIKHGMVAPDEDLSDRDIVELIFTPGFSTAEAVNDVSGRGVGMDVVKNTITRLKGVFEVNASPGAGTTFTIKLPLTLAIIQALLVRVAGELYAIPLDSVFESQRIEPADVRTVAGNEATVLRGQVVPLLRVADLFELGGERDPEKLMTVIVGVQGRQVGLVVDAFEGEQEIVIKPLSEVVGRIPGISGATILGNGSISLIVDVHTLVSHVYSGGRTAHAEFSGVSGAA